MIWVQTARVWVFSNMERWKLLPMTKGTGQHPVSSFHRYRKTADTAKNQVDMNPNNTIFV